MRFFVLLIITLCIGFAAMAQDADQSVEKPRPDVYPSRKLAAEALADQIAGALPKEPFSPPKISLIYSTSSVPPFTSDLANALQARFPSVSVEIDQVYRHKPTSAPTINIVDIPQNSTDRQGDFCAIFSNKVTSSQGVKVEDQATDADWASVASAVADMLSKTPNVGPTITLIYSSNGPNVASDLADTIQAKFPSFSVVIEQVYRHKPTTAPAVPAAPAAATGKSNIDTQRNSSTIARTPLKLDMSMEVKYIDKPWAADWTTFINSEVPNSWTVGKSNGLCFNEDKADQIAYVDAARQIVPMIRQLYATNLNQWNDDKMNDLVVHCLTTSNANAVNDKFVQHFNVSDGPAWRESILVSTDHNALNTLAASLYDTGNGYTRTPILFPFQKIVPAVSLVVVILLLYLFLNWITKGYFKSRLQITAFIVLVAVGIFFLLAIFFVGGRPVQIQP